MSAWSAWRARSRRRQADLDRQRLAIVAERLDAEAALRRKYPPMGRGERIVWTYVALVALAGFYQCFLAPPRAVDPEADWACEPNPPHNAC